MTMSKKLAFIVKQISQSLQITDSSDTSVQRVIDIMKENHPEYTLVPISSLKVDVTSTLRESLRNQSCTEKPSESAVLSLNQKLRINYHQSNSTKRTRPVNFHENYSTVDLVQSKAQSNNENGVAVMTTFEASTATTQSSNLKVDSSLMNAQRSTRRRINTTQNGTIDDALDAAVVNKVNIVSSKQPRPSHRLSNFAGLDPILNQIKELVFFPVLYADLYAHLGVLPSTGILLHGPSGCGKTSLALAIAGELNLPFFKVSGPELVGSTTGESEGRVRDVFAAALAEAPSMLFLDSLDVVAAKRESSQRGMDRRVVAQLCDCIDSLTEPLSDKPHSNSQSQSVKPIISDVLAASLNSGGASPQPSTQKTKFVILVAATNKVDAIDPSVRGRFSKEIALPVPDAPSRAHILRLMSSSLKIDNSVEFQVLGHATPGFVGSDLKALVAEAGMIAVSRIVHQYKLDDAIAPSNDSISEKPTDGDNIQLPSHSSTFELIHRHITNTAHNQTMATIQMIRAAEINSNFSNQTNQPDSIIVDQANITRVNNLETWLQRIQSSIYVEMLDFIQAIRSIQPAAKREGFAVVPDVTWGDVGALAEVREELVNNVLEPIAHPERFRSLGLDVPAGVLFFGPPGCGKTLLAKAVANQSGANFISVKGPELLNMYVGESESRVRQVFARARSSSPCVIFFDELDALCPRRGSGGEGGNGVSERVVNQLLTELDGLETRKDVYIIAATNRLELIDDAMLRPGRLGKLLYVPLPSPADRVSILQALMRKVSVEVEGPNSVDVYSIATDPRAEGFSGADLAALLREAGMAVVKEWKSSYSLSSPSSTASGTVSVPYGRSNEDSDRNTIDTKISQRHFEIALQSVRPSVELADRMRYERVQQMIKSGMGALQALRSAKEWTAQL